MKQYALIEEFNRVNSAINNIGKIPIDRNRYLLNLKELFHDFKCLHNVIEYIYDNHLCFVIFFVGQTLIKIRKK